MAIPKFSIVTPCYNAGRFLPEMIANLKAQTCKDYEHIVVDGGSKDGTVDLLKSEPEIQWISEKDRGQSDAINKGFRLARGEILAWQNADDLYFLDTLETVAAYFAANPDIGIVYGGYQQIDPDGKWICDVKSVDWNPWLFAHGRFAPVQPTVFWRRAVYENLGELDLSLHYCMDIDFYARASKHFKFARIPRMLGKFRVHLDSKTQNPENERKVYREYKSVLARNFAYTPFDHLVFRAFYYRSRVAAKVKSKLLKRM